MQPLHSIRAPGLDDLSTAHLLEYFENTWDLYELLFQAITGDRSLYRQPDPLRHPMIFYFAHTAVFYINKMCLAGLSDRRVNPRFEELFATGVDPRSPADLQHHDRWPDYESVARYRREVHERVAGFIAAQPARVSIDRDSPLWSILMAIEHDRIHFETSTVLIRQYQTNELSKPAGWIYAPRGHSAPRNPFVEIAAGSVSIGKPDRFATFGWDNEYGHRIVDVGAFQVSKNLISNAELLEFVQTGGYENRSFWSDEGWGWLQSHRVRQPVFWRPDGHSYRYRAMFDEFELPMNWPAEVNWHEATAWCGWRGGGRRLLSEAEFQRVVDRIPHGAADPMYADEFNLNLSCGSPRPVDGGPDIKQRELNDVCGNVWTWLADDFYPLPGFRPHTYYADFSAPYFDRQHAMLRGGSWASTGTSASGFYRLWFRRHLNQHAGFRVARSAWD